MSGTTRKCNACGEWYDARSPSCYICQEEGRETNAALTKAVNTSKLNGALAAQMSNAQGEARAEQIIRRNREGEAGKLPVAGYDKLFRAAQEQAARALGID